MKKLLLTVLILNFFTYALYAQDADNDRDRERELKEILKEKRHFSPVKISDALNAYKNANGKVQFKTTGGAASEHKISDLTSSDNDEGESFIAINPNNPAQLALSYMEFYMYQTFIPTLTFPLYYSNDSGNTWTKSSFNALDVLDQEFPGYLFNGGGDPVLAYDKSGQLHFSWSYLVVNPTQDTIFHAMHWATSTDNGQTLTYAPGNNRFVSITKANYLNAQIYDNGDGFHDRPWFAVDRSNGSFSGRLYTCFYYTPTSAEPASDEGICIRTLNTTNNNWDQRTQAYSGWSQSGNVAVDTTGKLHVTFADYGSNEIFHTSSTDGGQTFTAPHLVYTGHYLYGLPNMGPLPGPAIAIHDRENCAANLAIDGDNVLHLVWSDFGLGSALYASFYSRSTDGGTSWSAPLDIKDLLPPALNAFMPVVSACNKKVTISTYGITSMELGHYYNISSQDNGLSWGPADTVSTQPTDFWGAGGWFGDYANSVRTDCKVYNLWSDGRMGSTGTKMYVAATDDCDPLGIGEVTPINGPFSVHDIYPNPAMGELNISISAARENTFTFSILDLTGRLQKTEGRNIATGDNAVQLNIEAIAPGRYILLLESADGYRFSRVIEKK